LKRYFSKHVGCSRGGGRDHPSLIAQETLRVHRGTRQASPSLNYSLFNNQTKQANGEPTKPVPTDALFQPCFSGDQHGTATCQGAINRVSKPWEEKGSPALQLQYLTLHQAASEDFPTPLLCQRALLRGTLKGLFMR